MKCFPIMVKIVWAGNAFVIYPIYFQRKEIRKMIRDEAKIIVTPTGVSLKEALTKEVVKALNEEASIYMNYEIPEVKLGGNPPSGKESRRTRRMLELRKRKGRL